MAKPQSPELRRSGRTEALDPDNTATRLEAEHRRPRGGPAGPVPAENQPGHHPDHEQDQPDPDEFVQRFRHVGGGRPPDGDDRDDRDGTAAAQLVEHGLHAAGVAVSTPLRRIRSAAASVLRCAAQHVDPPRDRTV